MPMSINRTPIVLPPGSGETLSVGDVTLTYKTNGRQSNGEYTVMESIDAPRAASPVQWHKKTTLIMYVLEGTATLQVGSETIQTGPGGFAYVPPGTTYSVANQTDEPVKYLWITSPAGLEDYIREATDLVNSKSGEKPDMKQLTALRIKHDFFDPGE